MVGQRFSTPKGIGIGLQWPKPASALPNDIAAAPKEVPGVQTSELSWMFHSVCQMISIDVRLGLCMIQPSS